MKKLVLLASVLLLMAGMVFADVTFAPEVTGEASVTWGLDLQPGTNTYDKMNSGFDAANKATIDLGVTIDPFDAKTGEGGVYGEIELTDMAVTAKDDSSADDDNTVTVTAPTVTAKLYFMEGLYMRVCTNPAPEYDVVTPIGNLVTIDDNKQEGTWYDKDDDDLGTTIESDWGNAGYGFTYMNDMLTVNADFVSMDKWGSETYGENKFSKLKEKDYNKGDGDQGDYEDDDTFSLDEINKMKAVITQVNAMQNKYTYSLKETAVNVNGATVFEVPVDGDWVQIWQVEGSKADSGKFVTVMDSKGDKIFSSDYTLGLDVTYAMDGMGSVMAYVIPKPRTYAETDDYVDGDTSFNVAKSTDYFGIWGYGGKVEVTALSEYVTPMFAIDLMYDESQGFKGKDKRNILEWEAAFELPVTYTLSDDMAFDASAKVVATDVSSDSVDGVDYDAYFTAGADVMGASFDGAYQFSEMFDYMDQSASLTLDASYELAAMGGTVTPALGWDVDFGKTHTAADEEGYLSASVAAAIVDNTTFTLKYASGDLLEAPDKPDYHDMGAITFETKIAY